MNDWQPISTATTLVKELALATEESWKPGTSRVRLGYSIGEIFVFWLTPDKETLWPVAQDPLSRAMRGKVTIGEIMYAKNKKTGMGGFVSCMAVPLSYGENPKITGVIMMFRKIQQITDRW